MGLAVAGKGTLCKGNGGNAGLASFRFGASIAFWPSRRCITIVDVESEEALVPLAAHRTCVLSPPTAALEVILEGEDVSAAIRTQEVANTASQVAAFPAYCVKHCFRRQRAFVNCQA